MILALFNKSWFEILRLGIFHILQLPPSLEREIMSLEIGIQSRERVNYQVSPLKIGHVQKQNIFVHELRADHKHHFKKPRFRLKLQFLMRNYEILPR